jgi:hypothetical protein
LFSAGENNKKNSEKKKKKNLSGYIALLLICISMGALNSDVLRFQKDYDCQLRKSYEFFMIFLENWTWEVRENSFNIFLFNSGFS